MKSHDRIEKIPLEEIISTSLYGKMSGIKSIISFVNRIFDRLESAFEEDLGKKSIGLVLVSTFVFTLFLIELKSRRLIPEYFASYLPDSDFGAISVTFNLLLCIEIISLILNMTHSVANSVGKQFEVLSLILIRDTFKELSHHHDVLDWSSLIHSLPIITSTSIGGVIIFASLGLYYRIQKHQPITRDPEERFYFVGFKKLIALFLFFSFLYLLLRNTFFYIQQSRQFPSAFESFYTLLIFSDILLVLLSMVYSSNYHTAFRNSGFAVGTVMIRIALVAPLFYSPFLGVGAMLFVIGLTYSYNYFTGSQKAI
ncbi:MAG: hypothetical protein H7A24_12120 [Leptospiraceae bacterium]|nr:hypothetical protein [Leptospiraceae bacterium]MCP5512620.1 hypothetical protein [Leptospiraceae bacterium]